MKGFADFLNLFSTLETPTDTFEAATINIVSPTEPAPQALQEVSPPETPVRNTPARKNSRMIRQASHRSVLIDSAPLKPEPIAFSEEIQKKIDQFNVLNEQMILVFNDSASMKMDPVPVKDAENAHSIPRTLIFQYIRRDIFPNDPILPGIIDEYEAEQIKISILLSEFRAKLVNAENDEKLHDAFSAYIDASITSLQTYKNSCGAIMDKLLERAHLLSPRINKDIYTTPQEQNKQLEMYLESAMRKLELSLTNRLVLKIINIKNKETPFAVLNPEIESIEKHIDQIEKQFSEQSLPINTSNASALCSALRAHLGKQIICGFTRIIKPQPLNSEQALQLIVDLFDTEGFFSGPLFSGSLREKIANTYALIAILDGFKFEKAMVFDNKQTELSEKPNTLMKRAQLTLQIQSQLDELKLALHAMDGIAEYKALHDVNKKLYVRLSQQVDELSLYVENYQTECERPKTTLEAIKVFEDMQERCEKCLNNIDEISATLKQSLGALQINKQIALDAYNMTLEQTIKDLENTIRVVGKDTAVGEQYKKVIEFRDKLPQSLDTLEEIKSKVDGFRTDTNKLICREKQELFNFNKLAIQEIIHSYTNLPINFSRDNPLRQAWDATDADCLEKVTLLTKNFYALNDGNMLDPLASIPERNLYKHLNDLENLCQNAKQGIPELARIKNGAVVLEKRLLSVPYKISTNIIAALKLECERLIGDNEELKQLIVGSEHATVEQTEQLQANPILHKAYSILRSFQMLNARYINENTHLCDDTQYRRTLRHIISIPKPKPADNVKQSCLTAFWLFLKKIFRPLGKYLGLVKRDAFFETQKSADETESLYLQIRCSLEKLEQGLPTSISSQEIKQQSLNRWSMYVPSTPLVPLDQTASAEPDSFTL